MFRHRFLALVGSISIGIAVAACGSSDDISDSEGGPDSSLEGVTIRVSGVNDGLAFAFDDISPEFSDVPYEIELVDLTTSEGLAALSSGAVDLAHLSQPVAVVNALGNADPLWDDDTAPFSVVAAWDNPEHPGSSLVVADPSITDVSQLEGKRIGYSPTSMSHYFWLMLRDEFGLSDVEEASGPSPEIRSAFLSGALDAVFVLHRNARTFEDREQGVIIDSSNRDIDYYLVSLASRASLEDPRKAEAIADFLARTDRSMRWVRENPQPLIDYFVGKGFIEPDEAEDLVRFEPRPRVPLDDETVSMFKKIIAVFLKGGVIAADVDPMVVIDRVFDEGVVRSR